MASTCSKLMNRTAFSTLKSTIKSKIRTPSPSSSSSSIKGSSATSGVPLFSSSSSTTVPPPSVRRLSSSSSTRSVAALGCAMSMLPLHSTVAAARLTSCLSSNSRSCRSLSQGSLCHTSPGL